jgi:hypothetical protein
MGDAAGTDGTRSNGPVAVHGSSCTTDLHGAIPTFFSTSNDPSLVATADKHTHHDLSTVYAASRGWGGNGSSLQRK